MVILVLTVNYMPIHYAADTLVYLLYGSLGCQYLKSSILSEIVHSAANR
jgi:hypothetical protein